jgi:RimJ/RimL family protein N-acetyltransferase
VLIGKNVRCRALEPDDAPVLARLLNDPDITAGVGGWSFPVSVASQREFAVAPSGDTQRWLIEHDDVEEAVGMTGLWDIDMRNRRALTGVKILPEYQRQGIGVEVMRLVESFAFDEVNLRRLYTSILASNAGSLALFERTLGWKREGVLRSSVYRAGRYQDEVILSLLKAERASL